MDVVARALSSGEDLYGSLGVDVEASDDDIRRAYRALARRHHPDTNPDDALALGFRRIARAYEILGDERARAAYDAGLRREGIASGHEAPAGPVASHVAPRPTGAVASRGRAASANPADHRARVAAEERPRPPRDTDEWRLVSVLGRVVAAAAALVVIAVVVLIVSAGAAEEPQSEPTIWCKTPDGWYDCWQATTPNGP